jgi:hypothetical protein
MMFCTVYSQQGRRVSPRFYIIIYYQPTCTVYTRTHIIKLPAPMYNTTSTSTNANIYNSTFYYKCQHLCDIYQHPYIIAPLL